MYRALLLLSALLTVVGAAYFSSAGEPFKPGKLTKEEQAKLERGVTLRFHGTGDKVLDARRSRLVALHVPAGTAPSPLLAPGPFTAKFSGYLKLPLKGTYGFQMFGTGTAVLNLNGKEVLRTTDGVGKHKDAQVDLAKGFNKIEVAYQSPAKGDATLRVFWEGEGFILEPLPPDLLFSRNDEADLVAGTDLREGRFLYATLGCAQCHALPGKVARAECAMPELQQRGPSLVNAGKRLRTDWLALWIDNPQALRPEALMPRVLHGDQAPQQAADLAAFLATLTDGGKWGDPKKDEEGVKQGEKLFQEVGCIACHNLQDPKQKDGQNRLSLFYVNAKYQPQALAAYLRAPHANNPWTRMPDFKLKDAEADAIALYLGEEAKGSVTASDAAKTASAERGGKLFQTVGCVQCHATKANEAPPAPLLAAPTGPALMKGCLANDATGRGRAPDFHLAAPQVSALRTFLATDGDSLKRETPAEFSLRQMKYLQCTSCHRRDGGYSRLQIVFEDEGNGAPAELLPLLTWTGEKLKPDWTVKLLHGTHDQRARPWLKTRMPAFPVRADVLAAGLSHEHGFGVADDPRPKPDPKLAEVGAKLLVQQGGLNCVQCHAVGKQPAVAPFEAHGINLRDAADRLRYSYYPRWMMDPPHVDNITRMPKLTKEGQTTALRDVLDGDARRQFDAIWHYIQKLPDPR